MPSRLINVLSFVFLFFLLNTHTSAQTVDISGPVGSKAFGSTITPLMNGNYVITDPFYSENGVDSIGAVYLYNGNSNTLISTLKGSTPNDRVGSTITALDNGNFVVTSSDWHSNLPNLNGAVTWCNGITGLNEVVSSSNSLVGTSSYGYGTSVIKLANGNYVVSAPSWSDGAVKFVGEATWCSGTTGRTGVISSSSSLIGTTPHDNIGRIFPLANGNYLVVSSRWHNGNVEFAGSVTWCNGTIGLTGSVTTDNSFTSATSVGLGNRIIALANGNYLLYTQPSVGDVSVTFGNGSTGLIGVVNNSNTWMSSYAGDITDAVPLQNGNYLITSHINGEIAVTWADGASGEIVTRTTANSFLSAQAVTIVPLLNGGYILGNKFWDNNKGAVIFCKPDGSTTGTYSNVNSLVGAATNDFLGSGGITPLKNNNYIVSSPNWNGKRGASTFCLSNGSTVGTINAFNSLVGTNPNDSLGWEGGGFLFNGARALTNGNYLVISPNWNNYRGAITWVNGSTGLAGEISQNNSLVGSSSGDRLGIAGITNYNIPNIPPSTEYSPGVFALGNGNYVVASTQWNNKTGAVTWGNGKAGSNGIINSRNSLVGVTTYYNPDVTLTPAFILPAFKILPEFNPGKLELTSGGSLYGPINLAQKNYSANYVIRSIDPLTNKATITWGNGTGGTVGSFTSCNTVFGSTEAGVNTMQFSFDSVYNYLLVGRPKENIVSRYYPALGATLPHNNDITTSTIDGSSQFIFPSTTGCGQIAALTPTGANPASGSVTAKTWLETTQPANFVARHYEITPVTNPNGSTGTITLYFTQADFDGFNNQNPAPALLLPTSPQDASGIANLLVQKESGVSAVGTGLPGTYPGPITTIDPADADIIWNTSLQRWEVSFDVTGFSGFFIKTTALTALPLRLLNFSGKRQGAQNQLQWKTTNETGTKNFVVESSADGVNFLYSGNVPASGGGNYFYNDNNPLAKRTYYRLKMTDVDGRFNYSTIIIITGTDINTIGLYPNPVTASTTLDLGTNNNLIGTIAQLTDMSGRVLRTINITHSQEQLDMTNYSAGLYLVRLKDGNVIKVFKQ